MRNTMLVGLGLLAITAAAPAQTYTPTVYKIKLYDVDLSTDGTTWTSIFENSSGTEIDLADPNAFSNAFGSTTAIAAGTYKWIRMTVSQDLVWSYPSAPISLSNQTFTVSMGPPGPSAGLMTVYFATYDQGGKPNGNGSSSGGEGTATAPFLLGAGATVGAGKDVTLRMVFAVSDTLQNTGSGYDLQPPKMFFVSDNGATSTLSGSFNTVLYDADKVFTDSGSGPALSQWAYLSGHGVLTFDGSGGWSWTGTENDFDLYGGATGAVSAKMHSGKYGVNEDGSFWMLSSGAPGTLRGALSSDGNMVIASMFDSPTNHLMVYGVKQASTAAASAMTGGYYFTVYGTNYESPSTKLIYQSGFGVVTADGSGGVTGTQDSNELQVTNPTSSTPTVTGPNVTLADSFSDTLTIGADGTMSDTGGDLGGGILQSGDAACIAFSFASSYTPQNQFGFLVRQSTAGTFTTSSLQGTYFGGHFGDRYDSGETYYYSGFFTIVFDGAGSATVTVLENQEGAVSVNTFTQDYAVDTSTGIVTFSDPGTSTSTIKGAIGPNAQSFILTAQPQSGGSPSDERFLGLGLKQGS